MPDLATIIADLRGDAAVLRRAGHESEAVLCERIANDITNAAEEYLTFLPEADAALFSGHRPPWLRAQYESLARRGHAKMHGRTRYYRQCALPRRAGTAMAFEAGVEAARKAS